MTQRTDRHQWPWGAGRRLALALGAASLLAGSLAAPAAHAALVRCSTDPIVTLSNGTQVQLQATVTDSLSDITSIAYVLHGPKNTTVTNVVYTAGMGTIEHLVYLADQPTTTYPATTYVSTQTHGIGVSVYESGKALGAPTQRVSTTTTGSDYQYLATQVTV